ncbi:MAG: hypothetical protein ACOX0Z_04255 [Candidatus Nanosyncoccaceae bacterium]|jgi:hypothetical protein
MNSDLNQQGNIGSDGELGVMPVRAVKKPKNSKTILLIVIFLIILSGVVVLLALKDRFFPTEIKQPSIAQPQDPSIAKLINPTTGETWLLEPKAITAQGWLKLEDVTYMQSLYGTTSVSQLLKNNLPTYLEVGKRGDNSIILVSAPSEDSEGYFFLFERQPNGEAIAIARPQASAPNKDKWVNTVKDLVSAKVSRIDEETHYDSLDVPVKIAIHNNDHVVRPKYFDIGSSESSVLGAGIEKVLVTELGQSKIYKVELTNVETDLTNIAYYMETPLHTFIGLDYEPNQLSLEGYVFDNSVSLKKDEEFDSLVPIAQGCGILDGSVTRSEVIKDSELKVIGKTNSGQSVYRLADENHILYQKAYEEYQDSYGSEAISMENYLDNHGLVLIKNPQNELLVYVREKYAPIYGCAKPVIYLYPETTTKVSVVVGADVTISDPLYPASGWRDVLAHPDGSLVYQSKIYDSLFWEGNGHGRYPSITSGVVVARAEAPTVIRRQLTELGLNTKESNDFMEFWGNKIPDAPYVRLTWFGTEELNRLAPLRITPKPDTLIRVFLDMSGLERPISIPAQKLTSSPRRGFTVVEWGGLTSQKLE